MNQLVRRQQGTKGLMQITIKAFLNLQVVAEPELASILANITPILGNFFLGQPLFSWHLLQCSDTPTPAASKKKSFSHVRYFNDQSIIEIPFEEIKKKEKCLNPR